MCGGLILLSVGLALVFAALKAPMRSGFRVLLGVVAALIALSGVVAIVSPTRASEGTDENPPTAATVAPSALSPTDTPAERPRADFARAQLTAEAVETELAELRFEQATATVAAGSVLVTVDPGLMWDETDLVKQSGRDALRVFEALFLNPAVKEVTFSTTAAFTDEYGKSSLENAVTITYTRATAAKIDWDGLGTRAISDWKAPYAIADNYLIHPGVWRELKDKIPIEGANG